MRVLIAPDRFPGTMSAVEAADAIADGWARRAPRDELILAPMSDGGRGFCGALHASLGGDLHPVRVTGPDDQRVPATILMVGGTAYVESAQAGGLHLRPERDRDPERDNSRGVGELVLAALDAGATRVVIGLAGLATNDGGAGLLAALGATSNPPDALDHGPSSLAHLRSIDLHQARVSASRVDLVAATDVDGPLLGLIGATNVHGAERGIAEDRKQAVDATLEILASATDKLLASDRGAGAGGGLGFALLLLGARLQPGVAVVAEAVEVLEHARAVDLVVTGEGSFDFSSRSGTVPYAVAAVAAQALQPCIVLAGSVLVSAREMRAREVEAAYSMLDLVGEEASARDPAGSLAALAERAARTWSR